jgi:hypothetical protein
MPCMASRGHSIILLAHGAKILKHNKVTKISNLLSTKQN